MIDHVLGRPSTQFRKIQVFAVLSFWFLYLLRGNKHGPPGLQLISSHFSKRMTPWQTMMMTLLTLYVSRNFAKLVGLESPEPLANLYSRSYFRATWITTALDAGFWTAMNIKRPWLRDFCSLLFTGYYLIAAEQADEKVRRVRATLTVEHLRVSWNKATTPYLASLGKLLRPRLTRYEPVALRIPRPQGSSYTEPALAWLYFDGPLSALRHQKNIVLDVPGGGFVAMGPRTADDKLLAWAGRTGTPVLSLDYKKAPEYPYPYALNECYDVYHTIVTTRGRCLGLNGVTCPRIIVTGDSAGGNLAAGMTLMVLQAGSTQSRKLRGEDALPGPAGLVLIYPSLDMNIGSWMTDEQTSLIRDRGMRQTNRNILRRKSEDYYNKLTPRSSRQSSAMMEDYFDARENHSSQQNGSDVKSDDVEMAVDDAAESIRRPVPGNFASKVVAMAENQPHDIKTRLTVSSMISYFNDRILTPEMMRAMIILYIGPYNRPDFSSDFLLSPLLAPESLLARFPKTYFLTGERDPLVDDTVIFAGRIRQAKLHHFRERQDLGLEKSKAQFNEKDHVEVTLIPGISHGFLNFVSVFPEGWNQIYRCAGWILDLFEAAEVAEREGRQESSSLSLQKKQKIQRMRGKQANGGVSISSLTSSKDGGGRHHNRRPTSESSGEEDRPLEMSMLSMSKLSPSRRQSPKKSPSSSSDASSPQMQNKSPTASQEITNGHAPTPPTNSRTTAPSTATAPPNTTDLNIDSIDGDFPTPRPAPSSPGTTEEQKQGTQLQFQLPRSRQQEGKMTRLPSEEDLLGRRMQGLAGGLMGIGEGAKTP